MKKKEIRKLPLSKDTLRYLEHAAIDQAKGAYPTTTVLTRFPSCTAC